MMVVVQIRGRNFGLKRQWPDLPIQPCFANNAAPSSTKEAAPRALLRMATGWAADQLAWLALWPMYDAPDRACGYIRS